VPIVPGTVDIGNHTDDGTTAIALPFTYNLYGQPFSSVRASSNGKLEFTSNNEPGGYNNTCLPNGTYNNVIFANWDDLYTGDTAGGQGIFTSVSGAAPNRIFNIEWRAALCCAAGAPTHDFEVRLYEGQNRFDLVYGPMGSSGSAATVGVQNAAGPQMTQFECNAGGLTNGLLLNFSQPATNYLAAASAGAAMVAGTTDTGNHTDDGVTNIVLPFAYSLYNQSFTSANVGSNGTLQFNSTFADFNVTCLPNANYNFAVLPLWVDQCTGPCNTTPCTGCGIFTSVSGSAPNRIFNIEWRTNYFNTTTALDYEVRLYEGQTHFDVIYATVPDNGANKTIGVQKDTGSHSLQYQCGAGIPAGGTLVRYTLTSCVGLR
jgi:hypothetical protein